MSSSSSISSLPPAPRVFQPPAADDLNEKSEAKYTEQMDDYVAQLQTYHDALDEWTPVDDMQARMKADGIPMGPDGKMSKEDATEIAASLNKMLEYVGQMQDLRAQAQDMQRSSARQDLRPI